MNNFYDFIQNTSDGKLVLIALFIILVLSIIVNGIASIFKRK